MILLKILLTSFLIIALAIVAKKMSSRLAGLLSSLPMGTALMLFFYGLEHGSTYVSEVSNYNILGLSASLFFVIFYYLGSTLFTKPLNSLLSAVIVSFFAYSITAYSFSLIHEVSALSASIILLSSIFLAIFVFRNIPASSPKSPISTKTSVLIIRSLIASSFIIFLSFAPLYLPAPLAGVISSFPSVVAPLVIIIHFSLGKENLHEAIKVMPLSYISILIYSLSIGNSYLIFGVYWGTLISFALALVYIVFLQFSLKYFSSMKDTQKNPQ